jgi:hypothetical protein
VLRSGAAACRKACGHPIGRRLMVRRGATDSLKSWVFCEASPHLQRSLKRSIDLFEENFNAERVSNGIQMALKNSRLTKC